jgi:hypothetical protein
MAVGPPQNAGVAQAACLEYAWERSGTMEKSRRLLLLVIAVAALLVLASVLLGIDRFAPEENPAADLLPDLSGHHMVEGEFLTDYVSKLGEGASLLAGQPELAVAIAAVDQVIGCYQEVGAVEARVYSVEDDPLSAGVVAVGDRNKLLDPENLFACVVPALPSEGDLPIDQATIRPCTTSYTLERDGNEFYIIYAATTVELCQTFCDALEGCETHR